MSETIDPLDPSAGVDNVALEAARWFARLQADNCGASDRKRFEKWLDASAENRAAYRSQQEIWDEIGDVSADAEIMAMRSAALAGQVQQPRRSFWKRGMAIAASVAVAVVSLSVMLNPSSQPAQRVGPDRNPILAQAGEPSADPTIYRTQTGQRSIVNLSDGSVVELNTDSLLQVNFNDHARELVLLRGEAFFDVAKDKSRPFIVMVKDKRVTAIGTEFSVRLDKDRVRVTLVEGVVSVDRANRDGFFEPGEGSATQVMQAGEQLVAVEGRPFQRAAADTETATSWRQGRVVFDNEPLGRIVPELNRYTSRKLVLGDESLADMRVSGSFRVGSSDNFARTLQATFPVQATVVENDVILTWVE